MEIAAPVNNTASGMNLIIRSGSEVFVLCISIALL